MNLKNVRPAHLFYLAIGAFGLKIILGYTFLKDVFVDTLSQVAITIVGRTPGAILFGINIHENFMAAIEVTYFVAFFAGLYLYFKKDKTVTYTYISKEKNDS